MFMSESVACLTHSSFLRTSCELFFKLLVRVYYGTHVLVSHETKCYDPLLLFGIFYFFMVQSSSLVFGTLPMNDKPLFGLNIYQQINFPRPTTKIYKHILIHSRIALPESGPDISGAIEFIPPVS